jgi:hypothetical protein
MLQKGIPKLTYLYNVNICHIRKNYEGIIPDIVFIIPESHAH